MPVSSTSSGVMIRKQSRAARPHCTPSTPFLSPSVRPMPNTMNRAVRLQTSTTVVSRPYRPILCKKFVQAGMGKL